MQAVASFPPNSAAAMWADSIFGPGLGFRFESWDVFRSAFLGQYTPLNALITAQASFEKLMQDAYGEDMVGFSWEFNIRALQFDAGLRDAGHQRLLPDDLVRAFQLKLRGGGGAKVDSAIRMNATVNRERRADGRAAVPIGIEDLFAEAETVALQLNLGNGGGSLRMGSGLAIVAGTPAVGAGGTTPMDLDTLKLEINSLHDDFKARLEKRDRGKCWHCGKAGYFRAQWYSYKQQMAETAAKETAGRGRTQ
jgi:hypothetical protein